VFSRPASAGGRRRVRSRHGSSGSAHRLGDGYVRGYVAHPSHLGAARTSSQEKYCRRPERRNRPSEQLPSSALWDTHRRQAESADRRFGSSDTAVLGTAVLAGVARPPTGTLGTRLARPSHAERHVPTLAFGR
jgi:hypothetical protein